MELNTQDIESMFAAAAGAAEETGEKEVDIYGKTAPKKSEPSKTAAKEVVAPKPEPVKEVIKEPVKVQEPIQAERKPEPIKPSEPVKPIERKPEPVKAQENIKHETKPLLNDRSTGIINTSKGITEDSIGKVLEMNQIYAKFDDTQKEFVSGYFKLEEGENNVSKVIYRALIASQRDLDALSKIVEAKSYDPAGRAFFLMELENSIIEDVFEQVELLTGELGKSYKITDSNKLSVCRKIEGVISEMPKDVFTYIEKLQLFTNKVTK